MIVVKLEPEEPILNKEIKQIREEYPELDFEMKIEGKKQYIYLKVEEDET